MEGTLDLELRGRFTPSNETESEILISRMKIYISLAQVLWVLHHFEEYSIINEHGNQ